MHSWWPRPVSVTLTHSHTHTQALHSLTAHSLTHSPTHAHPSSTHTPVTLSRRHSGLWPLQNRSHSLTHVHPYRLMADDAGSDARLDTPQTHARSQASFLSLSLFCVSRFTQSSLFTYDVRYVCCVSWNSDLRFCFCLLLVGLFLLSCCCFPLLSFFFLAPCSSFGVLLLWQGVVNSGANSCSRWDPAAASAHKHTLFFT